MSDKRRQRMTDEERKETYLRGYVAGAQNASEAAAKLVEKYARDFFTWDAASLARDIRKIGRDGK